jgi:hypothetical protein
MRSTEWHLAQWVRTNTRPLCAAGDKAFSLLANEYDRAKATIAPSIFPADRRILNLRLVRQSP